jgi:hypothetical protein
MPPFAPDWMPKRLGSFTRRRVVPGAKGDGGVVAQFDDQHRILGDIDVTEDTDQGSYRSDGMVAKDPADRDFVNAR